MLINLEGFNWIGESLLNHVIKIIKQKEKKGIQDWYPYHIHINTLLVQHRPMSNGYQHNTPLGVGLAK